jgi:class 3 adenylate cyclase/CDGSH-type Zn-finger protein/nitrite reductase/ring-hydroxylating ferredoxin subunit|tara:strand:- start:388 stop:2244 length:1857 start_codon:yes stop_codon:yes gene_type:complete
MRGVDSEVWRNLKGSGDWGRFDFAGNKILEDMKKINNPIQIKVEEDKTYYWCSCGKSTNQPFCDGSHKNTKFTPVKLESTKKEELYFCGCKETNNPPFCDGSHLRINDGIKFNFNNNSPFKKSIETGKSYYWCSCGKSSNQPFCDGSHKKTKKTPFKLDCDKSSEVFFCGCKKSKNPPFCDGTHKSIKYKIEIQPDNKKIEISQDETILTASLRKEIPHLSACGGVGKCSTCRINIISGLENCSERTEYENKLAKRLDLPKTIRLACQTKVSGKVKYRRLLLDKRDLTLNSQLTAKKSGSVGTVRNLTIMFCDIKGFTPFSESLSAYDVIFILNRYFSIMREIILKNGGEINNYIGDAIMAIFGLKESRQQILRSVNTGLQMLEAMDEFKKYLKEAYDRIFDMRIGIHFGEVIVGSVGYGDDKKLTVIGDVVNIASRIESTNKDAGTRLLISENAFNEIKESVIVDNYLRLKLRGSSNLITLYEVNSIKNDILKDYSDTAHKLINGEKWSRTLPSIELKYGEKKKYQSNNEEIILIRKEGIYALNNICPHMNLPLDLGQLTEKETILCPFHNSEFCYKTGDVMMWVGSNPEVIKEKCEPLEIIPVTEMDSYIWVKKDL